MNCLRFIIELKAPTNPKNIPSLYERIEKSVSATNYVSIASKPFNQMISGFDLSYNLATYLLKQKPQLQILYHVTCFDLNKVNIQSRLILLKHLKIKRLLVLSGDGYEQPEDLKVRDLQFENSHELAECILKNFNWFDCVAVAGYPGGNGRTTSNNDEECRRLSKILRLGAGEIYTQCVFEVEEFVRFKRSIAVSHSRVRVVPSVALFEKSLDLERIQRLTRVGGKKVRELKDQLDQISPVESRKFSFEHLSTLCRDLAADSDCIDLCPFGRFDMAELLVEQVDKVKRSNIKPDY